MGQEYIIAHADKLVMKISGLRVKGLNTKQLEQILMEKLHTLVRVIGVTGEDIEMDVYNIEPDQIQRNAKGLIVPGPYQDAKAAMEAFLKALTKDAGIEDICNAMAEAVYAQYPAGVAKTL